MTPWNKEYIHDQISFIHIIIQRKRNELSLVKWLILELRLGWMSIEHLVVSENKEELKTETMEHAK